MIVRAFAVLSLLLLVPISTVASSEVRRSDSYGMGPQQNFDFWNSDKPDAPLAVFFHGGGFVGGHKGRVPRRLRRTLLDCGFAVASVNYRLAHDHPFPAPMQDGKEAVRVLRSRAKEYGFDPDRVVLFGNSAGAGLALWVAYQPESKIAAVAGINGQTSYNPFEVGRLFGANRLPRWLSVFYGFQSERELDNPARSKLFESASPSSLFSAKSPPTYLLYLKRRPVTGVHPDKPSTYIHNEGFARLLTKPAAKSGVTVKVDVAGIEEASDANRRLASFLAETVGVTCR